MRAGRLRDRVTIQAKSVTRSASGQEVIAWVDVITVWAWVRAVSSTEAIRRERTVALRSVAVTVRYRDSLTPANRLRFGTRLLDIKSIDDLDGRKRDLELLCQEQLQ